MLLTTHSNRLVVLDTETTGLSPQEGHRIIEIGCVELINRRPTGNRFHVYINPERKIDEDAIKIHGISNEFLSDKKLFKEIYQDFTNFVKDAELIIHNAPFDVGFINHELSLLASCSHRLEDICIIFDTLAYARAKHPGQRNSLDALCKRYNIDNSHRELHGALLDAEILADLYLVMTGGQFSLLDENTGEATHVAANQTAQPKLNRNRTPLTIIRCDDRELAEHHSRLEAIEKAAGNCLWKA